MSRRQIEVKQNLIDRVVNFIDPVLGAKRFQARAQQAIAGAYIGGSKNRRSMKEWHTSHGDADADILPDLPVLRERSRDLVRNNPLAGGALRTKKTNVVGTGLRLQASIDRQFLGLSDEQAEKWEDHVEREFSLWSNAQECDIERTQNFYQIQALAFFSTLENGDVFVSMPFVPRANSIFSTRIQLIEADRVSNKDNLADTETMAGGVEKTEYGEPIKYWVSKHHPGSRIGLSQEWEGLDAFGSSSGRRNVLHLFNKVRIGQTRGVPDLAPVIESLKQLGTYTDSEVMAAVVSSMFTVFVKSEDGGGLSPMTPSDGSASTKDEGDYKLAPGAILDLLPGEDIITANPSRPNPNYDPFVKAILEQVGVALELPFEVLTKHFTASYSAARAALIEAWKFFMSQRKWLADSLCQPIYENWLMEAVALGRVSAPGFLKDPATRAAYCRAEWIGPSRGQIDELKEVKAARERVEMGISSIEKETSELTGGNWEAIHRQRVKENKLRLEGGLIQPPVVEKADGEQENAAEE